MATTAADDPGAAAAAREYPPRPIVGVGGVILVEADPSSGRPAPAVVLIKRRFDPLAGRWSLPGGTLEVGETLHDGLARELREETGLVVEVGALLDVFDRITRDASGRVQYHYVLADYLCRPVGGAMQAGSDVSDVRAVPRSDLDRYDLTPKTLEIIAKALRTHV